MTTRKQYLDALDRTDGHISAEFLSAVRDAVNRVPLKELERLVAAQDVERIIALLGVDTTAVTMTAEAARAAFVAGGLMESRALQTTFNMRSVRAEAWLASQSSRLVTAIVDGQREAIRETLRSGLEAGNGPRKTALQIVGKIDKATGNRAGGIVGLNGPQADYVASARKELLELDPHYFTRTRRDRRFDPMVGRAIRDEQPLSAVDVDRIVGRYADRLLVTRGETIARTESIAALNAGREESLNQAVESGTIERRFVTRTWRSTPDARIRRDHLLMNGQKRPHGAPFESPTGARLMYPGDTSLGAGAKDVINCRCFEQIEVDFIAQAAARARL